MASTTQIVIVSGIVKLIAPIPASTRIRIISSVA